MNNTSIGEKIKLYIISLWLLFLFVIILKTDVPVYLGNDWEFVGILSIINANIIPILCIFFLLLGTVFYFRFDYKLKGAQNLPFRIKNLRNADYEHLTFLETCIIPLVCFNFENIRYTIVLILIIVIIGAIYSKTNMFYVNPTLSLLGYRIYRASKGNDGNAIEIIILTKDRLTDGNMVSYIELDDNIYYGKRRNKNDKE